MEFVWVESMSNYVGKFEVGQFEYQTVMGSNPSLHRGSTNLPVDSVTWTDAWQFCQRLQQQSPPPPGFRYTLPARSQWEAFATNALRDATLAVIKKAAAGPSARGSLKPNNFELHDVRGNVWEWTLEKTVIGSSFRSPVLGSPHWRPAGDNPLTYKDDETGFRVILAPEPSSTQQAMK
jgi:formylglycine-generating enzyme required for sulfatase activity